MWNGRLLCVGVCVGVMGLVLAARGAFNNYEEDPDLAMALHYDSETNQDPNVGSQAEAEKYYLKYLEHATDRAQRVKAYVQLGVLFGTNYHVARGEKADFGKCVAYMKKALAEAPEAVCVATLRARLQQVTPLLTHEERVAARVANYRWMAGLDASTIEEKWLHGRGDQPEAEGREREAFVGLLKNVMLAEEDNVMGDARATKKEAALLAAVVKAVPGTRLAGLAEKRLAELSGKGPAVEGAGPARSGG